MTDALFPHLASELTLPCGATLPNRIGKSAMSEALADKHTGVATDALVTLYERWGAGGTGLLISGNVMVALEARGEPGQVVITSDSHVAELRSWAEAAQAHGAKLWMQINHAGRQTPRSITKQPLAPSVVPLKGFGGAFSKPRELTDEEIRALIDRYAMAAAVAKQAGFSGVQIHGAHGYLVSQFLSPRTNLRDDEWGGDPARRMRFLIEMVRAMRAAVGSEFPLGVKLNSADFQRGGFTEEESMRVVEALEAEGVDLLEISGGNYESAAMTGSEKGKRESTRLREAYFLEYARKVRERTKMPLMLTGGMRRAETMESVLAEGAVDVIGVARPLCVEPDLSARLISGETEAALSIDPSIGVRAADDMLQVVWFQRQLERMAKGQDPDPTLSPFGVLAGGVGDMAKQAFSRSPKSPPLVDTQSEKTPR